MSSSAMEMLKLGVRMMAGGVGMMRTAAEMRQTAVEMKHCAGRTMPVGSTEAPHPVGMTRCPVRMLHLTMVPGEGLPAPSCGSPYNSAQ